MNMLKSVVATGVALVAGLTLADAPSVTEVSMTQQDDKTVVITYRLQNGPAVVTFDVEADGVSIGGRNLRNVSVDSEVFRKVSGAATDLHTIRWTPSVDWQDRILPANGVRAVVKAWAPDDKPDYMVVDLAHPSADGEFYYPSADFLPGGLLENAAYRTTKLVMRKIMAKGVKWTMCSPADEPGHTAYESVHDVTLTNNYYIGVFEVTKAQYAIFVRDKWGNPQFNSYFTGDNDRAKQMRPVERFDLSTFRGCNLWHDTPSETSFLGQIRAATGLADLDVPSEAQWEFACRAGYGEMTWGNGELYNDDLSNIPGRYAGNSDKDNLKQYEIPDTYNPHNTAPDEKGTAVVGSYEPNAWGLYDMHGNVAEWCQDFLSTRFLSDGAVEETANANNYRVIKGGSWKSPATECRSATRSWNNYTWKNEAYGFRLCCQGGLK